jgi:hypothetical protein
VVRKASASARNASASQDVGPRKAEGITGCDRVPRILHRDPRPASKSGIIDKSIFDFVEREKCA